MTKYGVCVAVLVLFFGLAPVRGAEGELASCPHLKPPYPADLNLSEEQRARIDSRQRAFMDEISTLHDELYSKKMELKDLWATARPDLSAIASKQRKIREISSKIQEITTRHQLGCREILTHEQREKLVSLDPRRSSIGD
jgi:Spy/CpxP family protein refolding chaperone